MDQTYINNPAIGKNWEDFRKEIFTPEEIAESNLRVALIGEIIKARKEQGISQKELEKLSGVKQPVIARTEKGDTNPQLDTILKILAPLGKTLAVVPLADKR
ncbi:helix-turn-helix domain-containing protein [Ruminococcus sp.]|uniref:helix-turn-helix domain-containing protein n=1 Tax=Ruminococcus sp. TaxID=41978 RepID=UPI00386AF1E5